MIKKITLFICIALFSLNATSQELNCQVDIMAPTLKNDPENQQIFDQLQKAIFNLMNTTKWTDDVFKAHERIESSILITIAKRNGTSFEATIQVSSRRPVYNPNYNSTIVNTLDKSFDFSFQLNAQSFQRIPK